MTAEAPLTKNFSLIRTEGTRISLTEVVKDYGLERPAVAGISLEIGSGEFVSFLGPSGSGKTTTLNMIAGLETLTIGTISLDSRDVSNLPAYKRNLGMLFQNYALFPHMTVAQNIAYPLQERKMKKDEIAKRVRDVLALVQLSGREASYPKQLSGGQQQRVALARSIVFSPRALLLDEPLGALDKNLRAALQMELRRIHRKVGSTFVFVTHDQEEAMTLSDRIVLFRDGQIEQVGTPEELYGSPDTLFAARFLGDSNTFPLERTESGVRLAGRPLDVSSESFVAGWDTSSSPLHLVVRPEHTRVTSGAVPEGKNYVEARVVDLEYVGSFIRIVAIGADENNMLTARVAPDTDVPRMGDEVKLWWESRTQRIVLD